MTTTNKREEIMKKAFGTISISDMDQAFCDSELKVSITMSCQRTSCDLNDDELAEMLNIKLKKLQDIDANDLERYKELTGINVEFKSVIDGCGCVECK